MNIVHVVENLNRGGLERMVIDLVTMQQRQGHHCRVVCLFEAGALAHELAAQGVPVHACGKRRGPDLRALLRLRRTLATPATDVLHTHNAVAHYHAVWASTGLGIGRVVNTRHGMGANRNSRRREGFYRRALARTDAVALVCAAARDDAVLRVQQFLPASPDHRARLRERLALPPQARLIGSVGRLNWTKDQASLIRAFATVRQRMSDAVLLLIGDGELRAELEQLAAATVPDGSVRFLGDRSDVRELLPGLDLFALSSLSEGYSMALLEACASALPIVATAVGGNGEIVRDGVNGKLVPAADAAALAEAMIDVLQAPEAARHLGAQGRAWVEAEGSLACMAGRYDALYRGARD